MINDFLTKISTIIIIFLGIILFTYTLNIKVVEYYAQKDPMLQEIRKILEPLHPGIKNVKLYEGEQSYTINKSKIFLCLKDKKKGDYYSKNMLIKVFLHEFAHYLNKDDIGHTEKFYKILNELEKKASEMGLYDPTVPPVENYCV